MVPTVPVSQHFTVPKDWSKNGGALGTGTSEALLTMDIKMHCNIRILLNGMSDANSPSK